MDNRLKTIREVGLGINPYLGNVRRKDSYTSSYILSRIIYDKIYNTFLEKDNPIRHVRAYLHDITYLDIKE